MTKEKLAVELSPITTHDLPEVCRLNEKSYNYPCSANDLRKLLTLRSCGLAGGGLVSKLDKKVIGFMIYLLDKSKLHLMNLAVDPDFRRQGVGSQLLTKLVSKLSPHRRTRITTDVRETNLGMQLFLKENGFRAIRVIRNAFDDTGEDAYLMHYPLPWGPQPQNETESND